jgi:Uma2 family endonuclease
MASKTLTTFEEFARMSTSEIEDFELLEGEVIPLPSATPLHAKIRHNVERLAANYFVQNPIGVVLGEIDCRLRRILPPAGSFHF